ncbi:ABC transporter substrate-binding protein [Kocuria sp. CPCC 205292]|uniref:ABC transporter substrate-binding protein n=1 Tax=Kocuria cellulosilytica TaxID=3071451 RepID=UPI0034D444DA
MKHPFASAAAAGTVLTFALTACGGGGSTGGGGGGEELQPLTIGVIPIAPSAPVQLALDEGIFEEHGLDVTIETAQGGAAMLPAVSGGSMDIGVGNPLSVILAEDQGLDMKILSGYSSSLPEGEDITGVAANRDAGIASWADLAGKRVAVNTVNGQGDLTIKEAVSQDGGDPDAVEFVEMPFQDMPAQLDRGEIDAAWVPEPFLTQLINGEQTELVGYNYQETVPGLDTMVTFSSASFAEENPEVLENYDAAIEDALEFAQDNPERVRETLVSFLSMPEEVAADLRLEEFDAEVDRDELETLSELMLKYDVISNEANLDEIIQAD